MMAGLLDICAEQFDTRDLYAVLKTDKTATANECESKSCSYLV